MPDKPRLQASATTTQTNRVELLPFRVYDLKAPERWDPSAGKLPLSYAIDDPNHRIRSGQILYKAPTASGFVTVRREKLSKTMLLPMKYELPESMQWDGVIKEGIPDRIGQRVTADLSEIWVVIEVWNNTNPAPGKLIPGKQGRTNVAKEWLSRAMGSVVVDAIVEGKWARNWVIPYEPSADDAYERDKGDVAMKIKVKNVRDGTPVRIEVRRINDIKDPYSDYPYTGTASSTAKLQPGLHNLVVRGQKVVQQANGKDPFVRFNRYDRHWIHKGNNFYMFAVGFGKQGELMVASERDYENQEKQCLHLRFTVFILAPNHDLYYSRQYARQLHHFFRKGTKYYRSYLMTQRPKDFIQLFARMIHRYIVIFIGHAAAWCIHSEHPTVVNPKTGKGFRSPERSRVSKNNKIQLQVGGKKEVIELTKATNNLNGLASRVNASPLGVKAEVMRAVKGKKRYYIVATAKDGKSAVKLLDHRGKDINADTVFAEMYSRAFPPDKYVCPTERWTPTKWLKRQLAYDRRRGAQKGCGHNGHVGHALYLGRLQSSHPRGGFDGRGRAYLGNSDRRVRTDRLFASTETVRKGIVIKDWDLAPRFAFWNGGCRTMLTTNMGNVIVTNGTRYYFGWVYVSDECPLPVRVFKDWIKGPGAKTEYDTERFLESYYRMVKKNSWMRYEPRLMTSAGPLPARRASDKASNALK